MKVFISYSSADLQIVRQLAADLKSHGVAVWLDEWEIKVGDEIRQKIEHGIAEYDYFVIVLSNHSIASTWVEKELSAAFMKEVHTKRIVVLPVKIEDCAIPPLIAGKKYADFSRSYETGVNELLRVLVSDTELISEKTSASESAINDKPGPRANLIVKRQIESRVERDDDVITAPTSTRTTFIISQVKRHRLGLIAIAFLAVTVVFGYLYFNRLSPAELVFIRATEQTSKGNYKEAILNFKQAIELDANYIHAHCALAVAYARTNQPGLAAKAAERAFLLLPKIPVNAQDKCRSTYYYHAYRTGNLGETEKALIDWGNEFPDDPAAKSNLGSHYLRSGKFEGAIAAADEYLYQKEDSVNAHVNKGSALIFLGRYDDAEEVYRHAFSQKLNDPAFNMGLYRIAFAKGYKEMMDEQISLIKNKEGDYLSEDLEADKAAFEGRWNESKDHSRKSIVGIPNELRGIRSQYAAKRAIRSSLFGKCEAVEEEAKELPDDDARYNVMWLVRTALAFAICNKPSEARDRRDVLSSAHSQNTLVRSVWLPAIDLAIELVPKTNSKRKLEQAIELLRPSVDHEALAEFWPQYLRGLAYLRLGDDQNARAEFMKIIELQSRGKSQMSVLFPLAHLGMARAYKLGRNTLESGNAYRTFRQLWQTPSDEIPVLIQAKREFENPR